MKEYSFTKLKITRRVQKGSILILLLFYLHINDLRRAIEHKSLHFTDNTDILLINKPLKKINKYINCHLKLLCQCIRGNNFSLNAGKTEIIIFRIKYQVITKHLNFNVSNQKINRTISGTYPGLFLNDSLTWDTHLTNIIPKFNEAVDSPPKICHYTPKSLLKTIYYSLFDFHFTYACQI